MKRSRLTCDVEGGGGGASASAGASSATEVATGSATGASSASSVTTGGDLASLARALTTAQAAVDAAQRALDDATAAASGCTRTEAAERCNLGLAPLIAEHIAEFVGPRRIWTVEYALYFGPPGQGERFQCQAQYESTIVHVCSSLTCARAHFRSLIAEKSFDQGNDYGKFSWADFVSSAHAENRMDAARALERGEDVAHCFTFPWPEAVAADGSIMCNFDFLCSDEGVLPVSARWFAAPNLYNDDPTPGRYVTGHHFSLSAREVHGRG
jgi:hypothetical protein